MNIIARILNSKRQQKYVAKKMSASQTSLSLTEFESGDHLKKLVIFNGKNHKEPGGLNMDGVLMIHASGLFHIYSGKSFFNQSTVDWRLYIGSK